MFKIFSFFKKNRTFLIHFLVLFSVTRISLTIVGLIARKYPPQRLPETTAVNHFTTHPWLNVWGMWDSGWYLEIAKNGYSVNTNYLHQSSVGFFPLYPLLIKLVAVIVKNYYLSGVVVSNISLFVSAYLLYRLLRLDFNDETSLKGMKYLFLHPVAFILSGVFSESLFLALLLAGFFFTRQKEWKKVGIFGFFLALTKPTGVLFFFLFLWEYLKASEFKPYKVSVEVVYLLLIPLGLFLFSFYTFYLTGNWLAYLDSKIIGWRLSFENPLKIIQASFYSKYWMFRYTIGWATILGTLVLTASYKKIGLTYWILGIITILIPLIGGDSTAVSLLRQSLIIFPFFIIFTRITNTFYKDSGLSFTLITIQLWLMSYWNNGLYIV